MNKVSTPEENTTIRLGPYDIAERISQAFHDKGFVAGRKLTADLFSAFGAQMQDLLDSKDRLIENKDNRIEELEKLIDAGEKAAKKNCGEDCLEKTTVIVDPRS